MKRKNKERPGIGWALGLSYLSALLLVVMAALIVLLTTFCSEKFFLRELEKSSFAATTYSLLCENYESYAAATGFTGEVLTSAISPEKIASDMQTTITDMYAGDTAFDRHYEISNAIFDAMQADLNTRGIEVTETVETGIALVADACRSDYANYVTMPLASQFYTLESKVGGMLWLGLALTALFTAAALVLLVRLAPDPRTGVRCLLFAFMSAAGLCLLLAVVLYPVLNLTNVALTPTSLRLLVLRYIKDLLGSFGIYALVYGAVAALLLFLTGAARVKSKSGQR